MSSNNNEVNRHLYLYDEVKESTVRTLVEKIHEINRFDDRKEKETYNNYDRSKKPIVLTINTPGGAVSHGLALMDTMNTSKTPIHTVALGTVASMGIPIYLSGSHRSAHEHVMFMIHDIYYGQSGTMVEHERRMEMVKTFMRDRVTNYILSKTSIRKEDIIDTSEHIKDWYFNTDDAIKLGVCHSKVVMHRLKKEDVQQGNFVVE